MQPDERGQVNAAEAQMEARLRMLRLRSGSAAHEARMERLFAEAAAAVQQVPTADRAAAAGAARGARTYGWLRFAAAVWLVCAAAGVYIGYVRHGARQPGETHALLPTPQTAARGGAPAEVPQTVHVTFSSTAPRGAFDLTVPADDGPRPEYFARSDQGV